MRRKREPSGAGRVSVQADSEGKGEGMVSSNLSCAYRTIRKSETTHNRHRHSTAAHVAVRTPQTEVTTTRTSVSSQKALLRGQSTQPHSGNSMTTQLSEDPADNPVSSSVITVTQQHPLKLSLLKALPFNCSFMVRQKASWNESTVHTQDVDK